MLLSFVLLKTRLATLNHSARNCCTRGYHNIVFDRKRWIKGAIIVFARGKAIISRLIFKKRAKEVKIVKENLNINLFTL